ncbi:MAG: HNH endonuclease [Verrucomicrobia bacterium]|nr:HNH endonuclease [Verrucomicrobiota bacterium]
MVISVRFNGVSRRSTHLLEEVYNRAALGLRAGGTPALASVRQALRPVYIPDEEFAADFAVLRLKKRGISGKRLKYFLAKLEKQLGGTDVSDATMSATLEHILPENPSETGWEQFSEEARARSCERLGNYSLLERGLNGPEAANFAFSEKQKAYAKSQYATSKELVQAGEWSEEAIAHRQKAMAKVAKTIWALEL